MLFAIIASKVSAADFKLTSRAFAPNSFIGKQYTCGGKNISPSLSWKNAPLGTKSFVLIVEDKEATQGTWVHWLLFNLPATKTNLYAGEPLPKDAISGKNSWNQSGYSGPCPPSGIHHYIFTLYALNARLTVNSNVNASDIMNAMQDKILAKTELIGLYGK